MTINLAYGFSCKFNLLPAYPKISSPRVNSLRGEDKGERLQLKISIKISLISLSHEVGEGRGEDLHLEFYKFQAEGPLPLIPPPQAKPAGEGKFFVA